MGAFGSLIVTLFSLCFRKLKTRAETKTRLIILLVVAAIFAIVVWIIGDDTGWGIFLFFALLFGWRMIADIILLIRNRFDPPDTKDKP